MRRIAKNIVLSVSVMAIIVVAVWYFVNVTECSLEASVKDDAAVQIQTLFLGEYYTPVTSLEIQESNTGNVILALVAKSEESRMHTVTLRKGENQFNDVYLDGYVVNYRGGSPYSFVSGKKYTVKVEWGLFTKEVDFVLPNGT